MHTSRADIIRRRSERQLWADCVEKVGSLSSQKIRQIANNTFDRR
jgi:hypothetical protein